MATHALPSRHILDDAPQTAVPAHPRKPSLMRRLYIALLVAQQRRAQRDIDRVLGDGTFKRGPLPPAR